MRFEENRAELGAGPHQRMYRRRRIVISLCPGADCAYVQERVARGTTVLAAQPTESEDGVLMASLEFSNGFPTYMRGPCTDIVGSVCELL